MVTTLIVSAPASNRQYGGGLVSPVPASMDRPAGTHDPLEVEARAPTRHAVGSGAQGRAARGGHDMSHGPASIDAYLATLGTAQRVALTKLRATIAAAVPEAEECFSYGLPAFRLGRPLVAFGAGAKHCALYPLSPAVVAAHARELARFETSKGTIRFAPDSPLPAALVRKLVRARVAELAAQRAPAAAAKAAARAKPAARATPAVRPSAIARAKSGTRATADARSKRTTRATPAAELRESARRVAANGPAGRLDPEASALLLERKPPFAGEIDTVRRAILGASPAIQESVKWNAPSYRTSEFFATVHMRSNDGVQLVFHRGAKARDDEADMEIDDPAGLARWLANDRCLVTLGSGAALRARIPAFRRFVRAWIERV